MLVQMRERRVYKRITNIRGNIIKKKKKKNLVARIDAMRNAIEATETTPAPPATDQNRMLPPDQAPLLRADVDTPSLLPGSMLLAGRSN
jgi:hypothetical protein